MYSNIIEAMQERKYSDNGDLQYSTSGSRLVDLNFSVGSFRNAIRYGNTKDIDSMFIASLKENPKRTIQWVLYLRDIYAGVGERCAFRHFMRVIRDNDEELFCNIIREILIEDYGRWDDIIHLLDLTSQNRECNKAIVSKVNSQIKMDVENYKAGKQISLLAKWLPSNNTSSKQTKQLAAYLSKQLGMKPRVYRKGLAILRKYLGVLEAKISRNNWNTDYEKVPGAAFLKYKLAFMRHDKDNYHNFIERLKNGKAKVNAKSLFLYEIIRDYRWGNKVDLVLEEMWKKQKLDVSLGDTLIVRDGSGSMTREVSRGLQAMAVGDSLALYLSELNAGLFQNKIVTFSARPKIIDLSQCQSLRQKLDILNEHRECSNTDIEKVFKLLLYSAIDNDIPQADMPHNILIISDMQFDHLYNESEANSVISQMGREFEKHGYKLPRLIFWNLCAGNITFPVKENDNGLIFVSGFSKNIVTLVLNGSRGAEEALFKELDRYKIPGGVIPGNKIFGVL